MGQWGKIVKLLSINMFKGHMDKAKGGRIQGRRQGGKSEEVVGGKMETTVLEQQ